MEPKFLVQFAFFLSVTVCICLFLILNFRARRDRQETLRQALQLPQALDPNSASLIGDLLFGRPDERLRAFSSVGTGLGFAAAGAVLKIGGFGDDVVIPVLAFSCVVLFHGLGRLTAYLTRKEKDRSAD